MKKFIFSLFCLIILSNISLAQVQSYEYKFQATVDEQILPDRKTEIWGQIYLPQNMSGKFPLLVFLHGNHGTCGKGANPRIDNNCQYTMKGTCPEGYEVVPNHRGYEYAINKLVPKGYIVISINANRGINCGRGVNGDGGLNLARGRLILKHIALMAKWNREGGSSPIIGVDLKGKINFNHVGLMGHSRGGEGVRAAYDYYTKDENWRKIIQTPVSFRGMFEIAPVDRQTEKILTPTGIAWNTILPVCDGDVSSLDGARPFDRVIEKLNDRLKTPKSIYTVWGANHNFFNTEWQVSDAKVCVNHEPLWTGPEGDIKQQTTGLYGLYHFFMANVGPKANPMYGELFNPLVALPEKLSKITKIDRSYFGGANQAETLIFENFDQETGKNTYGFQNLAEHIQIKHKMLSPPHGRNRPTAQIVWNQNQAYWQGFWSKAGVGKDISLFATLDLELSRKEAQDVLKGTNFSIQLIDALDRESQKIKLAQYFDLVGPVGNKFFTGKPYFQYVLNTARIPLNHFKGVDFKNIRSVKLSFDETQTGNIFVTNIRFSRIQQKYQKRFLKYLPVVQRARNLIPRRRLYTPGRSQISCRLVDKKFFTYKNKKYMQLSFFSPQGFMPRNELLSLKIGNNRYPYFNRPANGDIRYISFSLPETIYTKMSHSRHQLVYGSKESINCN